MAHEDGDGEEEDDDEDGPVELGGGGEGGGGAQCTLKTVRRRARMGKSRTSSPHMRTTFAENAPAAFTTVPAPITSSTTCCPEPEPEPLSPPPPPAFFPLALLLVMVTVSILRFQGNDLSLSKEEEEEEEDEEEDEFRSSSLVHPSADTWPVLNTTPMLFAFARKAAMYNHGSNQPSEC
jgi:hypothetical protein